MNIQEVTQNESLSLMTNSSMACLPPWGNEEEYHTCNETGSLTNHSSGYDFVFPCSSSDCKVIWSLAFLISSFGLVGNGIVVWLLGFQIKRNPFTTFILNLAVADFGVLVCIAIYSPVYIIYSFSDRNLYYLWIRIFVEVFLFLNLTGQFLLTAISIDRCVSVLCPIWHRCHRPNYLSPTVCALLWLTSFLLCLVPCILSLDFISDILFEMLSVTRLVCPPLMIISSLILFITICCKSSDHKRRKALIVIFLTLLFFLIFAFPVNAFLLIFTVTEMGYHIVIKCIFLGASLNSSINPLIYFLVGRQKRGQGRKKMKNILQRLFKEEEGHGAQMDSPV